MKKHAEMGIMVHKLTSVTSLAIPDLSTAIISAHYKADNFKQESNGLNNKPTILGNKRKLQGDPCILLAHDGQSQARVQELKDM